MSDKVKIAVLYIRGHDDPDVTPFIKEHLTEWVELPYEEYQEVWQWAMEQTKNDRYTGRYTIVVADKTSTLLRDMAEIRKAARERKEKEAARKSAAAAAAKKRREAREKKAEEEKRKMYENLKKEFEK